MIYRKLTLVLLFAVLAGCNSSIKIEEFADDSKEAKATGYIQQLIDGDYEGIKNSLDPRLKSQLTDDIFNQMRGMLGKEKPSNVDLVGYNSNTFNGGPTLYNLSYQYGYKDKWVLVSVAFRTLGNGSDEILGLNVYNPMDRSLQETHRFTLKDKGFLHYLFLVACTIVPLFILVSLVACARTKMKKRKWFWIIFIIFGFVQFSLNWSTGQVGFKILHCQLLGSGALAAGIYAPWILSFSIPIGAILFWSKRKNLRQTEEVQQAILSNPPPVPSSADDGH